MDHQIILSADSPISPTFILEAPILDSKVNLSKEYLHAWGVCWYPPDDSAATSIKEVQINASSIFGLVLKDWEQFHSSTFFCYLRESTVKILRQYVQPYTRSYAALDWSMTLLGNLPKNIQDYLPLGENPIFEPIGKSTSEYVFCWLLNKIREKEARSLKDILEVYFYELCKKINEFGSCSLAFTDGKDIIIYQDKELKHPFYYDRITPPHQRHLYEIESLKVDIGRDLNRTFMLFSSELPKNSSWSSMIASQMLIVRQGNIIWDSEKEAALNKKEIPIEIYISESTAQKIESDQQNYLFVHHETLYHYANPVDFSRHYIRLFPVKDRNQEVLFHKISISGDPNLEYFEDVFGNLTGLFILKKPFTELSIKMEAKVLVKSPTEYMLGSLDSRQNFPVVWMPWQRQMMLSYLLPQELPESQLAELNTFARSFVERNDNDVMSVLDDINQTIYRDFKYQSGTTTFQTTPYDVYIHRRGVCQDFANLFICLARLLSIPARYRVGYIFTGHDYDRRIQSDASHAWVEVYLPWLGWKGYDPTNGCIVGTNHVRVSCGRNYYDPPPTSGTIYKGGGEEKLDVSVKVRQLPLNI